MTPEERAWQAIDHARIEGQAREIEELKSALRGVERRAEEAEGLTDLAIAMVRAFDTYIATPIEHEMPGEDSPSSKNHNEYRRANTAFVRCARKLYIARGDGSRRGGGT